MKKSFVETEKREQIIKKINEKEIISNNNDRNTKN